MDKIFCIIESPYAGDVNRNVEYAKKCMKDSFSRNEVPFASHLLYPQALDDKKPEERKLGMEAGFEIGEALDYQTNETIHAFYLDYGMSDGMIKALEKLFSECIEDYNVEFRRILPEVKPVPVPKKKATGSAKKAR